MKSAIITGLIVFTILGLFAGANLYEWTQPRYHGELTLPSSEASELIDEVEGSKLKIDKVNEDGTITLRYDFFSSNVYPDLQTDSWDLFHNLAFIIVCVMVVVMPLTIALVAYNLEEENKEQEGK